MEFIITDPRGLTEQQLIETINSNCKTAILTRQEIAKLKAIAEEDAKSKPVIPEKKQTEELLPEEPEIVIDEEFEDEVNYYLSALNKITMDNIEEISSILPSKKNYRYKEIIYRLKLANIKSLKEIKDCIGEEGISKEILEEFQEDIELEKTKLKFLTEVTIEKDSLEASTEQNEINNRLIFTLTSGGNVRALEEIDHIEPEFYERFDALFRSIQDGTFKRIKRFASNSEFAGLSEVRGNQVRVVFDRIDTNSYAIITAFVKKTNLDTYYKVALRKRVNEYYKQCSQMKENLTNEEFLAENELYEQELFNKISPNQLQGKPSVKKKGCE